MSVPSVITSSVETGIGSTIAATASAKSADASERANGVVATPLETSMQQAQQADHWRSVSAAESRESVVVKIAAGIRKLAANDANSVLIGLSRSLYLFATVQIYSLAVTAYNASATISADVRNPRRPCCHYNHLSLKKHACLHFL